MRTRDVGANGASHLTLVPVATTRLRGPRGTVPGLDAQHPRVRPAHLPTLVFDLSLVGAVSTVSSVPQ